MRNAGLKQPLMDGIKRMINRLKKAAWMNRVEGWILFAKWTLAEGERRLLGVCYGLAVLLLWKKQTASHPGRQS